jgi:hypothetical protein
MRGAAARVVGEALAVPAVVARKHRAVAQGRVVQGRVVQRRVAPGHVVQRPAVPGRVVPAGEAVVVARKRAGAERADRSAQ